MENQTEKKRVTDVTIVVALGVQGWYGTVLVDGRAWQTTTAAQTPAQARAAAERWLRGRAEGDDNLAQLLKRYDTLNSGDWPAFVPCDDDTVEACRGCLNAVALCTCKAVR